MNMVQGKRHMTPPPLAKVTCSSVGGGALLRPCCKRLSPVHATMRPLSEQNLGGGARKGILYCSARRVRADRTLLLAATPPATTMQLFGARPASATAKSECNGHVSIAVVRIIILAPIHPPPPTPPHPTLSRMGGCQGHTLLLTATAPACHHAADEEQTRPLHSSSCYTAIAHSQMMIM